MNMAQKLATILGWDGTNFRSCGGLTLDDAATRIMHARVDRRIVDRDGGTDTWLRYTFADRSVIVDYGPCWDIGYPGCWCMQGVGHRQECEA